MSKRCPNCNGNGKTVGIGYMNEECNRCSGKGRLKDHIEEGVEDKPEPGKIDKRSVSYKKAIKDIKQTRDGMTTLEAEDIFNKEIINV